MIGRQKFWAFALFATVLIIDICYASASLLYCDTPIKDFGTVTEGEGVSQTFTVKNCSSKTVKVDKIITTCGCITPSRKGFVLEPDESTNIPVKFNSAGYGGQKLEKNIILFANGDKKTPVLKLTILGQVKGIPPEERINIAPMQMSVFNIIGTKHEIMIQGPCDKDVQIVVEGPKWLDVKIKQREKHNKSLFKQWVLEFSLVKPLSVATAGDLLVKTNLPRFEELPIRITVEPKPVLFVAPPVLFANVEAKKTCRKEITIKLLENSLDKNPERNDSQAILTNLFMADTKTRAIHIEPSSDSIQVELLPSEQVNKQKYAVTIQGGIDSPQYLRIMIDNTVIRKVPVIISNPK